MTRIIAFLLVGLALGVISASAFAQDINLTILSPKEGSETFAGRIIDIVVDIRLSDTTDSPLKVTSPGFACKYSSGGGTIYHYICTGKTPTDLKPAPFTVTATATWKIDRVYVPRTSTATLTLNVTNSLRIDLVYPEPVAATGIDEDKKHVKVRLMFPEGDKQYDLSDAVPAEINGETLDFVWNWSENLFVADYNLGQFELGEKFELDILLLGTVTGGKTFYPKFEQPTVSKQEFLEFGTGTLIAGAVFAILFFVISLSVLRIWAGRKALVTQLHAEMQDSANTILTEIKTLEGKIATEKKPSVEELKRKMDELKSSMTSCENDYYKRRISYEDYRDALATHRRDLFRVRGDLGLLKGEKSEAARNYESAGDLEKALKLFEEAGDKEGIRRVRQKMLWKQTMSKKEWEKTEQKLLLGEQ